MATNPDSKRRRAANGTYTSKCTDETTERVVLGIRAGVSLETAAAFAEIDESTLTRWRQRVEAGTGTPAERRFVAAVKQAIAEFKITLAARVTAPDTDRRTLLEYLGRRFPQEFGPVQRLNVDQHLNGRVEHQHDGELRLISGDITALTDQELEEMKRMLEKMRDAKLEPPGQLLQLPAGRR